ncbi:PEP-CTERM protein-sorting domain-containing protein [Sphingomonas antarctica]|uniref:PEPxxWA-CTERM sorting domain-containing protein n=1 Tax=Sphingomonas antarctica TaxID=2040274 RepID=UPI0039E8AD5C
MLAASVLSLGLASGAHATVILGSSSDLKDEYVDLEQREYVAPVASDFTSGGSAAVPLLAGSIGTQRQSPAFVPNGVVVKSFEGISQYDVASYSRNFIPPDTMGAVGKTQYSEFVNGGFAVFDKSGTVVKAISDVAFWNAAGQTSANGDTRVMYDKSADRWIALSFASSVANIQIAVSDTANAAGTWKSTVFTGFAGGTADYPTLALDDSAVYIGTNNFNSAGSFRGTTLNVIPLSSLVSAAAPTTAGLKQFVTPYSPTTGGVDGGYAIQGVNQSGNGTNGKVAAVSLFYAALATWDITNAGTPGAARVNGAYVDGTADYDGNDAARQPNALPDVNPNPPTSGNYFPSNDRVIDTLDDRVGSSVYEVNGRIYTVHTVTPTGGDHTVVRIDVIDAATNTVLDEHDIGDATHDFWEGSLAVNNLGQVVVAYNRSGSNAADGKISFLATTYSTGVTGKLTQRGATQLLQVSAVDDYHNGSVDGQVASGRQRWGDYSAVSLDPSDSKSFWVVGEFAREYNDGTDHPGGTGGSRWGTWISQISLSTTAVPEPSQWALMFSGFGLLGGVARRRRAALKVTYA